MIIRKVDKVGECRSLLLPYRGIITLAKVFVDLYGYHCIILVSDDSIFYVGYKMEVVNKLEKLINHPILTMSFSCSTNSKTTNTMLVGLSDGSI